MGTTVSVLRVVIVTNIHVWPIGKGFAEVIDSCLNSLRVQHSRPVGWSLKPYPTLAVTSRPSLWRTPVSS